MISTAIRAFLGIQNFWNGYWNLFPQVVPSELDGQPAADSEMQDFIDTTAKTMGVTKPIVLREDPIHDGWPMAHALGTNLLPGKAQILLATNHGFDREELKFVCAHEIAHIAHNDLLLRLASRVFTLFMLCNPYISHWTAISATFLLAGLQISLARWQEARADATALEHSTPDMKGGAVEMLFKKQIFQIKNSHLREVQMDRLFHPSPITRFEMITQSLQAEN